MAKGPEKISYKRCAKCDYLRYTIGMCELHARCTHPKHEAYPNGEIPIGDYPRGANNGVSTPKWCPYNVS